MHCNAFRMRQTGTIKGLAAVFTAAVLCTAAGELSANAAATGAAEVPPHGGVRAMIFDSRSTLWVTGAEQTIEVVGATRPTAGVMDGGCDHRGGHADGDHGDHKDHGDKRNNNGDDNNDQN